MTEADTDSVPAPGRRVDWIELFFDLAFVAFITQLAHGLHGAPGPTQYLAFIAWSLPAWWAWTNIMVTVNLLPPLPARPLGIALLISMGFIGLMAASVSANTERAWMFSLASAGLRLILLGMWVYRAKKSGQPLWRPLVYNGVTAVIWAVSALLPVPENFVLWAIALLIEVLLLRVGTSAMASHLKVDTAHASERLGLFMIILMGESVLSLVTSLAARWTLSSGVAALLGFVAICFLAWGFFVVGVTVIEDGLSRLNASGDFRGLLDTVMFLPYLLVIGVTMFAAGLASVVDQPDEPLALGASISLGGGIALFYFTNTIVISRYGTPWRELLPWSIPGVVLPLALIVVSTQVTATVSLLSITVVIVAIVAVSRIAQTRRDRQSLSAP